MALTALDSGQVSRALDSVSSVRGTVLYRGATTWVALSPGTANQVLVSGGVGADPGWLTLQSGGNVQTVGTPQSAQLAIFTGASTIQGVTALPAANFPALTGDVTTTAGSLAATIGLKAVTSAKMADMPSGTIKGNTAVSAGVPGDFALTAFLDLLSATWGALLFRGSGGWVALAPGSSGQVLQSAGSGANPSWVAALADGAVTFAKLASAAVATATEILSNAASKLLSVSAFWSAQAPVAWTYAATYTPDMSTFLTATMTLTGNLTLANPTNAKPGQAGEIVLTQDTMGGRTVSYGAAWKFVGGTPTASTAANAVDVISYRVISATLIVASFGKGVA